MPNLRSCLTWWVILTIGAAIMIAVIFITDAVAPLAFAALVLWYFVYLVMSILGKLLYMLGDRYEKQRRQRRTARQLNK
jgi:membrane protein implicated in regulation of membrane protease activity